MENSALECEPLADDGAPAEAGTLLPGDTQSVVLRYQNMVYGIALTHTSCRGDADDVFQETFLAYHRRQPVCHDEEHRKAWLITTTLNCARRIAGDSWRTRVVPLTPQMAESLPETFTFRTEEQDAIFRELCALPEIYRTVLHLFYFEDLPVARIAEVLKLEPATVKMRLSRGRARLRDRLAGGWFDE